MLNLAAAKKMQSSIHQTNTIALSELPVGRSARVVSVNGTGRVTQRLMEMGVIPGIGVKMIKTGPFGDPIEVRLRGYSLAMRKNEADAIEVSC
jgi:Fe2+ transport system protein FeoA